MSTKDSLGDRMKNNYENRYRMYLTRRTPVVIRIDGKAFHTFTRGFKRPYDSVLKNTMWSTAKELCENIMGCQLAYVQSDEISLLLIDYKKLTSEAWFDYNLQKVSSVAASMATMAFNKWFDYWMTSYNIDSLIEDGEETSEERIQRIVKYRSVKGSAMFDARAFNLPESEVCNYFIWRQQDATRNSIEMLGRCYFTQKELHHVTCTQIQDKLMLEKNVNWNDCPTFFKRGACAIKTELGWDIDKQIPIFTQDRAYIEDLLQVEEL